MSLQQMMCSMMLLLTSLGSLAQDVTTEGKKAYCNGNVIAEMKTPTRKTGFGLKALRQVIKDAKNDIPKPDYDDATCYIENSAGEKIIGFGMYTTQGRYFSSGFGGFVVFRFGDPLLDFTLPAAHIAKYEFYTQKIKVGYDVAGIAPEVLLTFAAMKHLIKPDGTLDTAVVRRAGQWAKKLPMLNQQQVNAYQAKQAECASRWRPSTIVLPLRFEETGADTLPVLEIMTKRYDVYDSSKLVGSVVLTGSWEAWAIEDGEYNETRIDALEKTRVEPIAYYFLNTEGCVMAEYRSDKVYNVRGGEPSRLRYYVDTKKESFADRFGFLQVLTTELIKKSFLF